MEAQNGKEGFARFRTYGKRFAMRAGWLARKNCTRRGCREACFSFLGNGTWLRNGPVAQPILEPVF